MDLETLLTLYFEQKATLQDRKDALIKKTLMIAQECEEDMAI